MEKIKLLMKKNGHGAFLAMDGKEQVGEMVISIKGQMMTVYHTEVAEKAEGRGLAKKLLSAMTHHAREQHLKVITLCPYVHAQFKRHASEYADIWEKDSIAE